jgi:hypothetical protein
MKSLSSIFVLVVLCASQLTAQTKPTYTTSFGSTISNADKEIPPYTPPDPSVVAQSQRSQRLIAEGEQRNAEAVQRAVYWANYAADVRDAYNAIQSVLPPIYYPTYVPVYVAPSYTPTPVGTITGRPIRH